MENQNMHFVIFNWRWLVKYPKMYVLICWILFSQNPKRQSLICVWYFLISNLLYVNANSQNAYLDFRVFENQNMHFGIFQERMLQNQQMNLANQKLLLENKLNLSKPTTSSKDSTQDYQNESKNICFIRATKSMADTW